VDVHPEDLLDREQYALLSAEERRRLDLHCVRCSACAIVRRATRDFARERHVNSADPVMLDRLVDAAIGAAAPVSGRYPPLSFVPRRRRRPWAVAAVVMFAATGATASFLTVRKAVVERAFAPMVPVIRDPRPAPNVGPAVPKKTATLTPRSTEPISERIIPALPLAVRAPIAREPASPTSRQKVGDDFVVVSAEQLLTQANDARRRRDTAHAVELYRQLQRQFPGTREEAASKVGFGRLLLDTGEDLGGAVALFSRYLAESPNGTLAEEARVGRALALMRLGRSSEERQAWLDLLSAHPRSVHAERARRRLDELR
jgi:hypothetical protein